MTLLDRIRQPSGDASKEIAVGEIAAAIFFNSQQITGFTTRTQIKNLLGLDNTDDAQLDQIATFISGMTANEQLVFSLRVLYAGILWEQRRIDEDDFKALVGIT